MVRRDGRQRVELSDESERLAKGLRSQTRIEGELAREARDEA